jgi:hypothetical protein
VRRSSIAGGLEGLYALALCLYPSPFYAAHHAAMEQTFRDALGDRSLSRPSLVVLVIRDLAESLVKEHLFMARASFPHTLLAFNALVLAAIATGIGLALYAIPQHVLRSGLDDPQIQLAGDLAARLERGDSFAAAVPSALPIDMNRSLAPFVIVYDDLGRVVAGQAVLNGIVPAPPAGVFAYVRDHGEERLTWQPVRGRTGGVRIAAVLERVGGAHPGFVLAGRNMREVEARIGRVEEMAGFTWLGMLGVIALGVLVLAGRRHPGDGAGTAAAGESSP